MVETVGGAKLPKILENFLRGAFGAAMMPFSALRAEIMGGENHFRPPHSEVWGAWSPLAPSLISVPGPYQDSGPLLHNMVEHQLLFNFFGSKNG